ncbi:MAG: FAD-binding oxidoreductase [Planctomycetota bacterium]
MSDWINTFSSQFGDAVCSDDASLSAQSVQGKVPACVASPDSEEQAAAMIRFAASHKIAVVPCGGGTSQGRCTPPPKSFLALSTKRLNKLIHHEPGDMVATVQGGMTLKEFQDAIRARGQWLPIDAQEQATLGGMVAKNANGPRALGYGTLRDMILGMTVINGDGVIRKCGGKVVKNVTGYALDKMYIGSFGTLGLITEITFKLRPLSIDGRYWSEEVAVWRDALTTMSAIGAKNLPIEMLQIIHPLRNEKCSSKLFISAAGTESELNRIEYELKQSYPQFQFNGQFFDADLSANLSGYGTQSEWVYAMSVDSAKPEAVLLSRARQRETPGATLRFGCVSSKLVATLSVLNAWENAPLSIGLNGGIIDLSPLTDSEAARISSEFEKLGVNFAFENVVGVNIPNRWGSPRPEWAIMKQLKAALDPQGIMNPGRFVV